VTDARELRLALGDGDAVAAALHLPRPRGAQALADAGHAALRPNPVLLLPGARGDHDASHVVALAGHLSDAGHPVVRSALSSRPPGSGVVGPAERSIGRLVAILTAARELVPDGSTAWVIGGASYGGRVASLAIAEHGAASLGVAGLILVAYPLHPPGRPDRLRVAHWPRVDVPVLMLSGDADPFLTLELLDLHAEEFTGPLVRVLVPGARHDLSVSSRSAPDGRRRTPAEAVGEHVEPVHAWLATLPENGAVGH
jgi:predicted alpha/beta-hydrolase family hydrolase